MSRLGNINAMEQRKVSMMNSPSTRLRVALTLAGVSTLGIVAVACSATNEVQVGAPKPSVTPGSGTSMVVNKPPETLPDGVVSIPTTYVPPSVTVTFSKSTGPQGPRAPFADSGDPASIAELKQSRVKTAMVGTNKPSRLPEDANQRKAHASNVLSTLENPSTAAQRGLPTEAQAAKATVDDTWAAASVPTGDVQLKRQMAAVQSDPDFTGFSDNDFELRSWVGIQVDGDTAKVSFIGVERFKRTPNRIVPEPKGWVNDFEKQFDATFLREGGVWKLSELASYRTDKKTGA